MLRAHLLHVGHVQQLTEREEPGRSCSLLDDLHGRTAASGLGQQAEPFEWIHREPPNWSRVLP